MEPAIRLLGTDMKFHPYARLVALSLILLAIGTAAFASQAA